MGDPLGHTLKLSPEELCKRATNLWSEIGRVHQDREWDDAVSHIVASHHLMNAVRTLLDRVDMTPEAMRSAYWDIRCALNELGFTPEREQEVHEEDKERIADYNFLKKLGTCFPEHKA